MFLRITGVFLLILATLFLPWWFWLPLAAGLVFFFASFWEIVPIFFFSDLLFGAPENRFWGGVFVTTLLGIIIYFSVNLLKKYLRP
ncbi:MAG TPA: hypothetical protein VJ103_00465 [Candidatus Paceibacterota bacterium]|nr:hypothetical protein [Candidatus Paceibacterota bacterium]